MLRVVLVLLTLLLGGPGRLLAQPLPGQTVGLAVPVVVSPTTAISVQVSGNTSCTTTDWVGLFAVGSASSAGTRLSWQYLNGSTTPPGVCLSSASLAFTSPATPGNYEVRFFPSGSFTPSAQSLLVGVTPAPLVTSSAGWPTPPTATVASLCGALYSPGHANWLTFASYAPATDGSADIAATLTTAMADAIAANKCLHLPAGIYLLTTNVTRTVASGEKLVLAGTAGTILKRTGDTGTLTFEAPAIATKTLTGTVAVGDEGLTVNNTTGLQVGDLVEVWVQMQMSPGTGWAHGIEEFAPIAAVSGTQITFPAGWRTNYRFHPHRALTYRMDGTATEIRYPLYYRPSTEVQVSGGGAYTLQDDAGYCRGDGCLLTFATPPTAGTLVTVQTTTDVPVYVYRGGTLLLDTLRWETPGAAAPNAKILGQGMMPRGTVLRNLTVWEAIPVVSGNDFLQPGMIEGLMDTITIQGGRYPISPYGRGSVLRNIRGYQTWHTVSIAFSTSHMYVDGITSDQCTAGTDGHMAQFYFVRNAVATRCGGGMNHRASAGGVQNAYAEAATYTELGIGAQSGLVRNEPLVNDPRDNPISMYDVSVTPTATNDMLLEDMQLVGVNVSASYLRTLTIRRVTTDQGVAIDGAWPAPVWTLTMDQVATTLGVNVRTAMQWTMTRLTAPSLRTSWGGGAGSLLQDSVLDGGGDAALLDDGGATVRTARDVSFRNAQRLFTAPSGDAPYWRFLRSTFDANLRPPATVAPVGRVP
jgi:hypothetical protein